MNINLAPDEQLVKSWDYAKSKVGRLQTSHSLFLTNKRIVGIDENKRLLMRQEIPLKDAKTVEGRAERKANFWTYVKLVLGVLLLLAIVGIFLLQRAIKELRYCSFTLCITTRGGEGTELSLGARTAELKTGFFAGLFGRRKRMKVFVDKSTAFSIIDEIGSAIVKAREI